MTTFQPACMLLGIRDRRDFFFKLGLKVYAIKIIWLFRHHFKLLLFLENTRIDQEANEVNELRARFMLFDVYYLSFVSVYSRLKEEGGEQ